jgi:hypothetical protein
MCCVIPLLQQQELCAFDVVIAVAGRLLSSRRVGHLIDCGSGGLSPLEEFVDLQNL